MSTGIKDLVSIWSEVSYDYRDREHGNVPDHVYFEQGVKSMTSELINHPEVFNISHAKDKVRGIAIERYSLTLVADSKTLNGINKDIKAAWLQGMTDALIIAQETNDVAFQRHVGAHFGIQCVVDALSHAIRKGSK